MITSAIRAQDLSYEEAQVDVVFIKPCPQVKVAEEVLGPFNEGVETKLPLWLAMSLANQGIVRLRQDSSRSLVELSKSAWREERSDTLLPVDPDFYSRLRSYLKELKLKVEKSPSQQALNEQRQAEIKANDLVNCRLQKIVKMALDKNPPKNLVDNMTTEEKVFFNSLRELIEKWRGLILGI
ncbi:MAG: hypothetical protein DRJ33_04270 [Candidatus Methanomethylicota archaeon]|uniref:GINS subunit domain-containing protein n=1 Tax=Thermoproteota archaeon TaxID=2056631 RepID=A0A497EXX7_9CREN|nr:MAG: hypothetical protein DRJ33_04270 [Candidatus Verstraetearchaeota archaeon]